MITCNLREKKYSVDFVSGRVLREMGPAWNMYVRITTAAGEALEGKLSKDRVVLTDAMDEMVHWFCLLFGNQFTPDEVYDNYPVDRLMHDISFALMAVQSQMTEVLDEFPTKAATVVPPALPEEEMGTTDD